MIRWTVPLLIGVACAPLAAQQPSPDSIYQLAQVEVHPEALNGEELGAALFARYPAALKAAGVSGEVVVSMVIGPDGLPRTVELVRSTDTLFNAPTLEVASLLRFSPAQMGGRPVPVRITLPVPWEAGPAEDAPGPDALGGYEMREVDVQPRFTNRTEFQRELERNYPPGPRDAGVGTVVQVRFLINPNGTTSHVRVTNSEHEAFDAPTIAAVQTLRFTPAQIAGQPVAVWAELPIEWGHDAPGPDEHGAYSSAEVERRPRPTNVQTLQRALERLYPRDLLNGGITGTVTVRFRVDENGMVRDASIIRSTDARFNEATLTAIQVLRFRPATAGGKPVSAWVQQQVEWLLIRERLDPELGQPAIGCTINTPRGCG